MIAVYLELRWGNIMLLLLSICTIYSLNDQALLNATGCDHRAFTILLSKFQVYYHYYTFHSNTDIIRRKNTIKMVRPREGREICQPLDVLAWY